MKKINYFWKFGYTFVLGLFALTGGILVGGTLWIYCRIKCFRRPEVKVYKEFALWCRVVLWLLRTRFKIVGEFPDIGENFEVVSNHTNWMDAFFIMLLFNGRPGVAFVDAKMFKYPILGYFLKKVDAIAINKKDKVTGRKISGIKSAFQQSLAVLSNGIYLFLFPEGTRTPDGTLQKFKHGAAELAILTGKKILPIGISGSYEFSHKGQYYFKPTKITLAVGELITYTGTDKKELTAIIRTGVEKAVEKAAVSRKIGRVSLKPAFT